MLVAEPKVSNDLAWDALHHDSRECQRYARWLLQAGIEGGPEELPLLSLSEGYSWQAVVLARVQRGQWQAAAQAARARDAAFREAGWARPFSQYESGEISDTGS